MSAVGPEASQGGGDDAATSNWDLDFSKLMSGDYDTEAKRIGELVDKRKQRIVEIISATPEELRLHILSQDDGLYEPEDITDEILETHRMELIGNIAALSLDEFEELSKTEEEKAINEAKVRIAAIKAELHRLKANLDNRVKLMKDYIEMTPGNHDSYERSIRKATHDYQQEVIRSNREIAMLLMQYEIEDEEGDQQ